jgi:prepilin-type processing-associated H-X9-DG protein
MAPAISHGFQCPCYQGGDNWVEYPFTGYNYNSSYVGFCVYRAEMQGWPPVPTGRLIAEEHPARPEEIRHPPACAIFGDGDYLGGANKLMRSPFVGRDGSFSGRSAGTQGYRHLKRTNVAFADGHAQSWSRRFTDTYDFDEGNIQPDGDVLTGFLSADNHLYDLE